MNDKKNQSLHSNTETTDRKDNVYHVGPDDR